MNSKKTNTNKCFVVNIPQIVTTRKYKVDIDSLKILLRNSKKASKLSCKQISEILNKPVTLVEHWFRTDSCFAIPDDDIWMDLKKILQIFGQTIQIQSLSQRVKMEINVIPLLQEALINTERKH